MLQAANVEVQSLKLQSNRKVLQWKGIIDKFQEEPDIQAWR